MKKLFMSMLLAVVTMFSANAQTIDLPISLNGNKRMAIDLRTTAHLNWGMDTYQTIKFRRDGYREASSVFGRFVNNASSNEIAAGSMLLAWGATEFLDNQPRTIRDVGYALWAVGHIVAVDRNRRKYGYGVPLIAFRF